MSMLGGLVERLQCPICGCVMHGSAHYGSLVTCRKIVELQAKIATSASELAAAREQVRRLREALDKTKDRIECSSWRRLEQSDLTWDGGYRAAMESALTILQEERALAETAQPTRGEDNE